MLLLVYGLRRTAATRGKKSTRATRTLVPVQYLLVPDSLSTVFPFFEAISSLVDMIHGHFDSLDVVVVVVYVAPGILRTPTRRVHSSGSVYDSHTHAYHIT